MHESLEKQERRERESGDGQEEKEKRGDSDCNHFDSTQELLTDPPSRLSATQHPHPRPLSSARRAVVLVPHLFHSHPSLLLNPTRSGLQRVSDAIYSANRRPKYFPLQPGPTPRPSPRPHRDSANFPITRIFFFLSHFISPVVFASSKHTNAFLSLQRRHPVLSHHGKPPSSPSSTASLQNPLQSRLHLPLSPSLRFRTPPTAS